MNFLQVLPRGYDFFVPALNKVIACSHAVAGQKLEIGVRHERLDIDVTGQGITVELVEKLGNINFVHVVSSLGERLTISSTLHHSIRSGDTVGARLSQDDYFIFDRATGARILA